MSLFAIGDIHGYTEAITSLINAVGPSPEDTVVFLGDYVDKGPDVAGTVEYLIECSKNSSWIFLRGNHDQMFLDAHRDASNFPMWECLSGEAPLQSYGNGSLREILASVPDKHINFLANRCVNYYETADYIFVHAGIRPHVEPKEEETERLQWTALNLACAHFSSKTVICGHSSQPSGMIADLGHTICIDTGITKGNHITCLNLDDFTFTKATLDGRISWGTLTR